MNPPDQPTPRTNAIAHRGYPEPSYIVEMTDLARILEKELTETERLRFGADADRRRLRAEVERLKGWLADPHALHAHCLRTLTDGQIAHLFGERMTEVANRADKAEAELAAERARLDYLALNMGTPRVADALDCDYSECFPIRDAIDLAMKNETPTQ